MQVISSVKRSAIVSQVTCPHISFHIAFSIAVKCDGALPTLAVGFGSFARAIPLAGLTSNAPFISNTAVGFLGLDMTLMLF
jgi:hypothetical protein